MKYFVISDIHSNYDYMISSLLDKGFLFDNKDHIIILLGDAFDRGPNPYKVYLFIKEMIDKKKLIWIVGNHEFLMLKRINERKFNNHNETYDTLLNIVENHSGKSNLTDVEIFEEIDKMNLKEFLLSNLVPFYELGDYVLAHGFIPTKKNMIIDNWRNLDFNLWYSSTTKNGMRKVMMENIKIPNKTLICGHTRASFGNVRAPYDVRDWDDPMFNKLQKFKNNLDLFKPYFGDGVIGIDACCNETKMINCLVLDI